LWLTVGQLRRVLKKQNRTLQRAREERERGDNIKVVNPVMSPRYKRRKIVNRNFFGGYGGWEGEPRRENGGIVIG